MTKCNKMRHDCGGSAPNCFNIKKRLKFSVLEKAMPRKIGFTDIDGFSELNGYCCFIEWKEPGSPLEYAQETAFKRLTELSPKIVVFVVAGDAEDMSVQSWCIIYEGHYLGERAFGSLEEFLSELAEWGSQADYRWLERERANRTARR
jgi:hypothetical protein